MLGFRDQDLNLECWGIVGILGFKGSGCFGV